MTLEELLMVVNDSTRVEIVDAGTGELYATGYGEENSLEIVDTCDYGYDVLLDAEVMDINIWNGLVICIDLGVLSIDEDWEDEEDFITYDGWAQQDVIDMYRRER